MQTVLYSRLRQNMKKYFDDAVDSHEPIIVVRKDDKSVVILSLEDYNAIKETEYLLSNENNAKHLLNSLENAHRGKKTEKELIDE